MRFEFSMYDDIDGRSVVVSQPDLDYLPDVLELMLSFLKGCGYTYVEQLSADKGNNEFVNTVR